MRAKHPFWHDDFESALACSYHPRHKWVTLRLGDALVDGACANPDEKLTICAGCYVVRCGTTADRDRCTLWRHHSTAHIAESGKREALGGIVPAHGVVE